MPLVVAPLALALVLAPASPRLAVRHSARVLTPRCAEEEPQRTYRVTVPGQSSELYAFRQKAEVEEPKFKYNKKTHWLVDIPSWSPVWPERHFEFDHSLLSALVDGDSEEDRALASDLVTGACNAALEKAQEMITSSLGQAAGELRKERVESSAIDAARAIKANDCGLRAVEHAGER